MKTQDTKNIAIISLYAALIFTSIQFLRFPLGHQFIHIGNALVVVGVLIFGSKKGALAAALGLGIFDILNGYAAEVWITILESLIVCLVLHFYFEKGLKGKDTTSAIISVALVAALTKIILNLFKYTLINHIVGSLALNQAFSLAFVKILGTFGSALATLIAVPLLYPIFKELLKKANR